MDAGILVPDSVVIGMISSKIDNNRHADGFIFDGFPRTIAQAEALDHLLKSKGACITMMLALEVENEELKKRLLQRGKDSGRSDDQDEHVIMKRIDEYNAKTAPVKNFYTGHGKFVSIKGIGSIENIFQSLCIAIDSNT